MDLRIVIMKVLNNYNCEIKCFARLKYENEYSILIVVQMCKKERQYEGYI